MQNRAELYAAGLYQKNNCTTLIGNSVLYTSKAISSCTTWAYKIVFIQGKSDI